jgi:8-oxo-dGTP pyrophosphatase MutT (NUDIX family)
MSESFIQHLVADAHSKRQYRPVTIAVTIEAAPTHRVLCVCLAKNPRESGFVQGGVSREEEAAQALRRGLLNKAGIKADYLREMTFLGHQDLEVQDHRPESRGYTLGKRYLFYRVVADIPGELKLNPEELYSYTWVNPECVADVLSTKTDAKRDMLLAFLAKAYH